MDKNSETRKQLPLTNKKLWDMAKLIADRQKAAKESTGNVDWNIIEEMWFEWLEDELLET